MKPRITFIVNNRARQKRHIIKRIEEVFYDYPKMVLQTEYRYHAMILTQQHADSSDIIIAVGGDGTLNEVLNGLMSLPENVQDRVILGLIPAGLANDFNRSLGIPSDLTALRMLIEAESYRDLSVGHLKYKTTYDKDAERFFINEGEVGIAAETVRRINNSPRLLTNNMTLTLATLQSFVNFKYPYVRVISDTIQWQGRITSVVFTLGKFFGGGLAIAPDADLFSGNMHLILVEKIGSQDFVKSLYQLRHVKPVDNPRVHYFQTSQLIIDPLEEREAWVQVDGEFLGKAPIEVRVIPKQVKVIAPQKN